MQNIGFTQYESQVYLALLQQSHISGYELAKISGVPASKIYQILNKLTDKEMVLAIDSDPKKYVPLPPAEILTRYKNDYLDTMDHLSEKLGHLYAQDEVDESYIWNLSGRTEIIRKLTAFISEAKEHLNEILNLNPYHAEAHLQMARILLDQHKNKEAKEHLLIAHQVWENADEAFVYAQETKSLLAELDH